MRLKMVWSPCVHGNLQAEKSVVWGFYITERGDSLCQALGNHRVRCYRSEYDKYGLRKNPGLFQLTKGKELGKNTGKSAAFNRTATNHNKTTAVNCRLHLGCRPLYASQNHAEPLLYHLFSRRKTLIQITKTAAPVTWLGQKWALVFVGLHPHESLRIN